MAISANVWAAVALQWIYGFDFQAFLPGPELGKALSHIDGLILPVQHRSVDVVLRGAF